MNRTKKLTNEQKINLVLKDLEQWMDSGGRESDDSLIYAFENGYSLHAASLWLGSGAMSEGIEAQVKGIRISRKAEMKEINQLCDEAHIYICKDCSHHGFHSDDLGESIGCFSCGKTAVKQVKEKVS